MCNFILKQLEKSNKNQKQQPSSFEKAISNSSFWSTSLKLLSQFQKQAHICTQPSNQKNANATLIQMMSFINLGLQHTALSVRDAALELYIVLFQQKGRELESLLSKDLKPIIVTKLKQATHQARRIAAQNEALQASGSFSMSMASKSHDSIYKNCLNYFKSSDPKRRIKGLIYVKKKFNSDTMQSINQEKAREIWQNISNVLRSYLSDSDSEIYLQSIKLLQSALGKVVKLLNSFDLLISLSSLITLIIQKIAGVKSNMRCQIASDKILLHMSKISQIGAPVILREMISALEKQGKSKQGPNLASKADGNTQKILGIINSLVSHFGDDILSKGMDICGMLLNALGMTLNSFKDSQLVSNLTTQVSTTTIHIVTSLSGRNKELIQNCVSKIDISRRYGLNKILMDIKPPTELEISAISTTNNNFNRTDQSFKNDGIKLSTARKMRETNTSTSSGFILNRSQNTPANNLDELRNTTKQENELLLHLGLSSLFANINQNPNSPPLEVPEQDILGELKQKPKTISQMRRSQSNFQYCNNQSLDDFAGTSGSNYNNPLPRRYPGICSQDPPFPLQSSSILQKLPDISQKKKNNISFLPPINPRSNNNSNIGGGLYKPRKQADPFSSYNLGSDDFSLKNRSNCDPFYMDKMPGVEQQMQNKDANKMSISEQRRNKKPPLYNPSANSDKNSLNKVLKRALPQVQELSYSDSLIMNIKSPTDDILKKQLQKNDREFDLLRKSSYAEKMQKYQNDQMMMKGAKSFRPQKLQKNTSSSKLSESSERGDDALDEILNFYK